MLKWKMGAGAAALDSCLVLAGCGHSEDEWQQALATAARLLSRTTACHSRPLWATVGTRRIFLTLAHSWIIWAYLSYLDLVC